MQIRIHKGISACTLGITLALGILVVAFLPASAPAEEVESFEFRIVNWNAAGSGVNSGNDAGVAASVLNYVTEIDANVITLQEVTGTSLTILEGALPGWDCNSHVFGKDEIAVCVDGTATNFNFKELTPDPCKPDTDPPEFPWWGYVQVEYKGVLITSVHTRSFWRDYHRAELHKDVQTGIIAGDFNHIDAADPGWHQTDLDLEPTWYGEYRGSPRGHWKIDHVLTVEEPQQVWGDAQEKEGSDHRVVLAEVTFQEDPNGPDPDQCVYSQGYWKNHNQFGKNSPLKIPWPIDEETILCEQTLLDILQTPPRGGNAFYILGHQRIAVMLNMANGAEITPEVDDALWQAEALFCDCEVSDDERQEALALASLLDDYNNGLVGPPKCDFCGDGEVQEDNDEQCDDGNNDNGDGCSCECERQIALCGQITEPGRPPLTLLFYLLPVVAIFVHRKVLC